MWLMAGEYIVQRKFNLNKNKTTTMDKRVQELIEQFNAEFPCGDTYELALFIYQKAQEDCHQ